VTAYVLTCDEANVVPASSTSAGTTAASCTSPYYAPQASLVPALSMSDGALIGMAILAVWAIAAGWKMLGRVFW